MARGEHIHHGYFLHASDSKENAQIQLMELLVELAGLQRHEGDGRVRVLDVGCGIGGTARFLAREYGCEVVGITISMFSFVGR